MTQLSTLPAPLQNWAPWLELFPLPCALALGPLIQRLDSAIGPLRVSPQSGNVEPDGFDGLARRGLPERLLISEWLMLEEFPDEFLRRASENEQSFLRLARRDPHSARASLALFDAGSSQLGAPRLAQLAALVVLSRRAQNANASFGWGILQKPGELRLGLTREDVEWWLESRGEAEISVENRENWLEWERENGAETKNDDKWLIGGAKIENWDENAHFLILEDELDPFCEQKAVAATLKSGTSAPKSFRLILPDERTSARLLREPFSEIAPKSIEKKNGVLRAVSNLVWASSGYKLFARGENNVLLAFSIPNSTHAQSGATKVYRPAGEQILAVGRVNRATVCVSMPKESNDYLLIEAWGRGAKNLPTGRFELEFPFSPAERERHLAAPLGQVFPHENGLAFLIKGLLVALGESTDKVLLEQGAIHAAAGENGALRYAYNLERDLVFQHSVEKDQSKHSMQSTLGGATEHVFVGFGGSQKDALWASSVNEKGWMLRQRNFSQILNVPDEQTVVAALATPGASLGLILQSEDKRTLSFLARDLSLEIPRFGSEIESVAACPFDSLLAIRLENGEICVYSLGQQAFVFRLEA